MRPENRSDYFLNDLTMKRFISIEQEQILKQRKTISSDGRGGENNKKQLNSLENYF